MWERFSFYGMRALLILYMTDQLLYSDSMSYGIYAAYGSLIYATPLIGGMLADKVLGYRKAILWGGILMAIGHVGMAIETPIFFYGSLAFLIVGNGFFKPNISSFVGALYKDNTEKMESGFTIFYLGINLGGAIAPLLCAWLAVSYGWHYGFGLAGVGMLAGLLFFQRGIADNVFGNEGLIPNQSLFDTKTFGLNKEKLIQIISVLSVPVIALMIVFYEYESYLISSVTVVLVLILGKIFLEVSKEERGRLLVAIYFTALMALFWGVFEQSGSSVTLFASRNVNLVWMNASQTNSINSGFIILLALPFSMLWGFLNKIKRNPISPLKFGFGLFFLGLGFVIFALSTKSADAMAQTPMIYLVLGYLVLTTGELFISPIGLSKITELSPAKYTGFIMGIWFLASSYGHFFAGQIAQLTAGDPLQATWFNQGVMGELVASITGIAHSKVASLDVAFQQLYSFTSIFAVSGLLIIGFGLIAMIIAPLVKKLMFGVR